MSDTAQRTKSNGECLKSSCALATSDAATPPGRALFAPAYPNLDRDVTPDSARSSSSTRRQFPSSANESRSPTTLSPYCAEVQRAVDDWVGRIQHRMSAPLLRRAGLSGTIRSRRVSPDRRRYAISLEFHHLVRTELPRHLISVVGRLLVRSVVPQGSLAEAAHRVCPLCHPHHAAPARSHSSGVVTGVDDWFAPSCRIRDHLPVVGVGYDDHVGLPDRVASSSPRPERLRSRLAWTATGTRAVGFRDIRFTASPNAGVVGCSTTVYLERAR